MFPGWRLNRNEGSQTNSLRYGLLVDVVQRLELPTQLCPHKSIDNYFLAGTIVAADREFFWPFRILLRFGRRKAFRGVCFPHKDLLVTRQQLGSSSNRRHAIRHRHGELRHLSDAAFVAINHRDFELHPERVD